MRSEGIDHFAARRARRHRFRVLKGWQLTLPSFRQLATHHHAPLPAQLRILRLILTNERIPFRFLLRAAFYASPKMGERFVGHIELFSFMPAEMAFSFAHGLFARRCAVGLARASG